MTEQRDDRVALLIPGAQYGIDRPLLDYARLAVKRRGSIAYELSWAPEPDNLEDHRAWARDQVAVALDRLGPSATAETNGRSPLIIGKSMASLGARAVADRKLPAIWLTPLLHDRETVSALEAATGPTLLIGGTADPAWQGDVARAISSHVLEIADADHSMLVPGPLASSANALGQVSAAIEAFIDETVWT